MKFCQNVDRHEIFVRFETGLCWFKNLFSGSVIEKNLVYTQEGRVLFKKS